jgi:hypothetical protein
VSKKIRRFAAKIQCREHIKLESWTSDADRPPPRKRSQEAAILALSRLSRQDCAQDQAPAAVASLGKLWEKNTADAKALSEENWGAAANQ